MFPQQPPGTQPYSPFAGLPAAAQVVRQGRVSESEEAAKRRYQEAQQQHAAHQSLFSNGGNLVKSVGLGHKQSPFERTNLALDDYGHVVPNVHNPRLVPPIFFNVESFKRNTTADPNANSFRLNLHPKPRNVIAIEIVELMVCNPTAAPVDSYFYVANGLVDENGKFTAQNVVGVYRDSEVDRPTGIAGQQAYSDSARPEVTAGGNTLTPVDTPVAPGAPATGNTVGHQSFGKFFYDATRPAQYWQRTGVRKIQYLRSTLETLSELHFALVDRNGAPLQLDVGAEWTCTLMISSFEQ